MRAHLTILVCILALMPFFLTSCGSSGGYVSENRLNRGYNPGVGPFDSNGNYVESWADDKRKGRWWRKSTTNSSSLASNKKVEKPKITPPVYTSSFTPRPAITPTVKTHQRPAVNTTNIPSARPKPTIVATPRPKPKPKPKPVVITKPKSKPPIGHTIVKGDTLYGLSRKYNISVTAIQRANGLKGSNLRLGQRLIIPRY